MPSSSMFLYFFCVRISMFFILSILYLMWSHQCSSARFIWLKEICYPVLSNKQKSLLISMVLLENHIIFVNLLVKFEPHTIDGSSINLLSIELSNTCECWSLRTTMIKKKKNESLKFIWCSLNFNQNLNIQNVTNPWAELTLENQPVRGGCPRTYKYIVKLILNSCGILGS